jgi:acetyltransferase-like isoleucine patch superfamily enzyme
MGALEAVRAFTGLAWSSELLARPALLERWGEAFSGADDSTLVVAATPGSDDLERLGGRLDELGLAGPDGPDLLAIALEDDLAAAAGLTEQVRAVLSDRPDARTLGLPVVGSTTPSRVLRALAAGQAPTDVAAALIAADRAREADRLAEAATLYELVLRLAPEHSAAWVGLARVRLAGGATGEAADCARTALALDVERVDVHRVLADVQVAQGDVVAAAASYRIALELALDRPSPSAADPQAARIVQHRALSTCERVTGAPHLLQPAVFVGPGRIEIGQGVRFGWPRSPGFHSTYAYVEAGLEHSVVSIGDDGLFNNGCVIRSEGPGITIGPRALFGTGAEVMDSDFHDLHPERRHGGRPKVGHVEIGENVWLGSNVLVLKGTRIGANTVVGAGSVVTVDLPADVVAAGQPARPVRELP